MSAKAGRINGEAPLFERFSLGNSRTLRGWDKYDIAPAGGDRMFYASVEYQYHGLAMFLDSGSAWNSGTERRIRVSTGFGFTPGTVLHGRLPDQHRRVPRRLHHGRPPAQARERGRSTDVPGSTEERFWIRGSSQRAGIVALALVSGLVVRLGAQAVTVTRVGDALDGACAPGSGSSRARRSCG